MPYSTQADLEIRYGQTLLAQLSDRDAFSGGGIDADLFERAITDADALIDGYLASRYLTPVTPVPSIVTDLSQRIAIYYAHGETVSDKIKADHDAAMRQLKDIANGVMKLASAGVESTSGGGGEVITNEPERPFTSESMKGYI